MKAFTAKGRFTELLSGIPVKVVLNDNPLLKEPLKLSHVKPLVGYDTRPELHLRPPEPGNQEI